MSLFGALPHEIEDAVELNRWYRANKITRHSEARRLITNVRRMNKNSVYARNKRDRDRKALEEQNMTLEAEKVELQMRIDALENKVATLEQENIALQLERDSFGAGGVPQMPTLLECNNTFADLAPDKPILSDSDLQSVWAEIEPLLNVTSPEAALSSSIQ